LPFVDEPFRCAAASAERAEPMFGTASTVGRWLLVEQAGPWGPSSLPESRLDPATREALREQAARLGARPLLIRRHQSSTTEGPRAVLFVDSRPGRERVLSRVAESEAELLELPLGTGWAPRTEPLFLVCTHGRHDACCAMRGRPLAAAFAAVAPEETWECSHIGGDRFASNTLVLPAGLYYGRLAAADVPEVVARTAAGRVLPDFLRGRSSSSLPAQVAQHFARGQLQRERVADLTPTREEQVSPAVWRVELAMLEGDSDDALAGGSNGGSTGGTVVVTVRRTSAAAPQQLTCQAPAAAVAPAWELVDLEAPRPREPAALAYEPSATRSA
jgi:hypothetical protein